MKAENLTEISTLGKVLLIPGKTGNSDSWLPLWMHLLDTMETMRYLLSNRVCESVIRATGLDEDELGKVCSLVALLHDIGKCTPLFVKNILRSIPFYENELGDNGITIPENFLYRDKSPHALAGEIILRQESFPDGICSVVGAHHGKPCQDELIKVEYKKYIRSHYSNYYGENEELWDNMRKNWLRFAKYFSGYSDTEQMPRLNITAQMLITGLLIEADWIASNTNYFPLLPLDEKGDISLYPNRAKAAFKKLNFPDCWISSSFTGESEWFCEKFGFMPNEVQKLVIKTASLCTDGGIMILESQMGTGKTEAALAAAEILSARNGAGGIFFGLPTQATSNGIFSRLLEWSQKVSCDGVHSIGLVHSAAELNDEYTGLAGRSEVDDDEDCNVFVHQWFTGRKQALLNDFVVGTVDSALMMALKQKHIMLRHLGLCGKVVIIDECHAYDAYMSCYLERMLSWLGAYKTPVILLSATLPKKRRESLIKAYLNNKTKNSIIPPVDGYPLLTWTEGENVYAESLKLNNSAVPKKVHINKCTDEDLTKLLKQDLSRGGCAGIIVNTVKRAQQIAEALTASLPDKRIILFHSQFVATDRAVKESELIKSIGKRSTPETRDNLIVVGTQVLEQSLDIDFDVLYSDLCPMDLLLQRIGRLHRHSRTRPSPLRECRCVVLNSDLRGDDGKKRTDSKIYHQWLLKRTSESLPDIIDLNTDIPRLVEAVYSQPENIDDDMWDSFELENKRRENNASAWLLKRPQKSKSESANSISGIVNTDIGSDKSGEAKVRDIKPTVEVLVMQSVGDGKAGFLPWISSDTLRDDSVPSDEEAKQIARQRLRLPFVLSVGDKLDSTITELERENANLLSQWQNSHWLKGELVLLLDSQLEKELNGYKLKYDKNKGLTYERSETQYAGKGV
ncbi:MAG: CRISPR-associated helicase Cas3' [Clostridiales bacterium]|nr:CRISPR-associated helicase Cas3' [Clostridiales bacterium]